jgi:putative ABC transporter type IV
MLTRFVLYGLGGWCGEVLFTALTGSLPQRDWRLTGRTYLWMFPIYGLLAPLYEPVHELIRGFPFGARAVVWSLGFTAVECSSGWLIERLTGRCPWDYVASANRLAINAYIRWDYFPLWAAVGLALEPAHDVLVRLTPVIEAALRGG